MTILVATLRPWFCLLLVGSAALPALPSSNAAAPSIDPVPAPLQPRSGPISMAIAGQPAVLRVVRSNVAAGPTLAAVETAWRFAGDRVRRDADGNWQSVSRVDSQGIEVLQLRAGDRGGSDGYLVRWTFASGPAAHRSRNSLAHRLLPETAVLLSDTESHQPHGSGRTLVAWMPGAVDTAERLLVARADVLGLQQRRAGGQGSGGSDRTQFFRSAGAELALSLHSEGVGTALVIHLMETTR